MNPPHIRESYGTWPAGSATGSASSSISDTPDSAAIVGKALLRAADRLAVSQVALAGLLGLSTATVSRLVHGRYALQTDRKDYEHALLFLRVYRSLLSVVGNDETARSWLDSDNLALGVAPRSLLSTSEGLVRVVHYLDAQRGRV